MHTAAEVTQDAGLWRESWLGGDEAELYAHAQGVLSRYEALRFPIVVYRGLDLRSARLEHDSTGGGWFWSLDPSVAASFSVGTDRNGAKRAVILRGVFTSPKQFTGVDQINYEVGKYSVFQKEPEWVLVGQPEQVTTIGGPHPGVRR